MKVSIDSQAVNGESVNEVGERPTYQVSGCKRTNNRVPDNKSRFRTMVKRKKGLPKSSSKAVYYSKHCTHGCESTSLAKEILLFEKTHRRCVEIDDVVDLFNKLQHGNDDENPHAEYVVRHQKYLCNENYYTVLHEDILLCDDEHIHSDGVEYVKYRSVIKKKSFIKEMTFDQIISEHVFLVAQATPLPEDEAVEVPHALFEDLEKEDASWKEVLDAKASPFETDVGLDVLCPELYASIQPLMDYARKSFPDMDAYVDIVEDLMMILYFAFYSTDSNALYISLIAIYKKYYKGSFSGSMLKFIMNLCSSTCEDKVERPYASEGKNIFTKIKLAKNSIFLKRVTEAITLAISFGFVKPICVTVKNVQVYANKGMEHACSSDNYFTYTLNLLDYFFNVGHSIFTGDYSFLYHVDEMTKIDDDIVHLQSYIQCIQLGSYKQQTGFEVEDYHEKLLSTINTLRLLSSTTNERAWKTALITKLSQVTKLLVAFDQCRPLDGLREAPFSIAVYGKSSVGKSSITKMLIPAILTYNDIECSDDKLCTLQPTDKFYSTYKADCTAVLIDDICNTVYEKCDVNPAELLISLVNNVSFYAPKSESNEKGKILVRPKIVATTSNILDFDAARWSVEPISVVRRMRYYLEVKPKPEYTTNNGLDYSKIPESEQENLRRYGIQDLWKVTVMSIVRHNTDSSGNEKHSHQVVVHNGIRMEDVDIYTLIQFLNTESKEFFANQKQFVKDCKENGRKMKYCKVCNNFQHRCCCIPVDKPAEEPPIITVSTKDEIPCAAVDVVTRFDNCCRWLASLILGSVIRGYASFLPNDMEIMAATPLAKIAFARWFNFSFLNYVNYLPRSVRLNSNFQKFYLYTQRYNILWKTCAFMVPSVAIVYGRFDKQTAALASIPLGITTFWSIRNKMISDMVNMPLHVLLPRIQTLHGMRHVLKAGFCLLSGVAVVRVMIHMFNAGTLLYKSTVKIEELKDETPFGNLNPMTKDDIEQRDNEHNCWAKTSESLPRCAPSKTMTTDQLLNRLSPNCLRVVLQYEGYGVSIGCVAIKSNVMCLPLHLFKNNSNIFGTWRDSNVPYASTGSICYKLDFIKHNGVSGNSFSAIIDKDDIVQIGDLDLVVFRVGSGGSFADITPFLLKSTDSGSAKSIRRNKQGELLTAVCRYTSCATSYMADPSKKKYYDIPGGKLIYDYIPQQGDCMAMIVRDTTAPSIAGFHISGIKDESRGSYIMMEAQDLNLAIDRLQRIHGTSLPFSGGYIDLTRLGKQIIIDDKIDEKAPASYVKEHNYIIRGSIGQQVSYYSEIKPTILYNDVLKIFNFTNKWGQPKFGPKRYMPWYSYLAVCAQPTAPLKSDILKLSKQDYISTLKEKLTFYVTIQEVKPLELHEIINGIPGVRFVDHINFKSSIGYPLTGKKAKYLEGEPGNYSFTDEKLFLDELQNMESKYERGERYYPMFKACLKDEATKLDKDKVRVFHAADITLQLAWRKYGLPLLRFLSLFPLASECAVGINPYNNEWNELHDHITRYGTANDRILAGDYSEWDKRLPPDLVWAAFNVLIELAQVCPLYTERDIMMLQGLATDTMYFTCHFNGTLIEFNSGIPSGHNLTAHINSICNSLALRYGYYMYANPAPFRKYCSAITYGDDFECGVDSIITNFNHLTYKEVVSQMGMVLTMPDKKSTPTAFLNVFRCDFLKRRSVLCPIDMKYYGALDIDSMIRSLLFKGKTSTNPREHAYSVIRGFVHDLSYHEVEIYNSYIVKIRELCKQANIVCPEARLDYDGYYAYRNRKSDSDTESEKTDTLDSADTSPGYQMTPKASDLSTASEYYVSSTSTDASDECSEDTSKTLTELQEIYSYLDTIVQDDDDNRSCHMELPSAEVFGAAQGIESTAPTATGTAVFTSAREHKVQSLEMQSQDLLSLRQDVSRSLGDYLSRPRVLFSVDPLNLVEFAAYPLQLFLTTDPIKEKIRNYAYLNARLHIKVATVASPTASGAVMVSLHPWASRDNGLGLLSCNIAARPDIYQQSQLPNIVVDISKESGGEISMPIICPSNGLNITDNESIQAAFQLNVTPLVQSKVPASSSIRPNVTIYAWLSDVSLTGTTAKTELPQADEYNMADEDTPSSDAITMKQAIKNAGVTLVGKATEIGLDMAMAAMGFSNPNSQEGCTPNVPRTMGNMSTYNAPTNVDILAGDYKNEVPIDSKEMGYEDYDHMNINNIISRWGLIGSFSLPVGPNSLAEIHKRVLPVHPMAVPTVPTGSTNIFTPTPLAMGALPFNRWRGAIKYKFVAIGSAFKKGKISISHDVIYPLSTAVNEAYDLQTLNTVLWDISTTSSIEIMVPWASNLTFKSTGLLKPAINTPDVDGNLSVDNVSNGALIVSRHTPINDLEYSNIDILVYNCGVPGMAFGDMRAVLANYTFAGFNKGQTTVPEPQAAIEWDHSKITFHNCTEGVIKFKDGTVLDVDIFVWYKLYEDHRIWLLNNPEDEFPQAMIYNTKLESGILSGDTPDTTIAVNINGLEDNPEDHDKMAMLCMGEKWYSIRQIIKRYTHNWTRCINYPSGQYYYRIRLPDRPLLKGYQGSDSLNTQPNDKRVTYARDSFLSFYSVAFLGYRGSFRHKLLVQPGSSVTSNALAPVQVYAIRSGTGFVEERVAINAVSTGSTAEEYSKFASSIPVYPDFRAGGTVGVTSVNPVLEYTTPFVCSGKFAWAQDRAPQKTKFTDDGGYDIPWHQIIVITTGQATTGQRVRIDKFIAAGDDFSLFFYLYAPRMTRDQPEGWSQS